MKVILLQDIKGVGKKDDLINAADGHARNYLIPKKLAVEATDINIKQLNAKKKNEEQKRLDELEEAKKLGTQIEKLNLEIKVKCGENGKLFGSVTNKEIADEIENISKLIIDKKKISIDEPIKSVGDKKVTVKLHPDVTIKITIKVISI